MNQDQVTEKVIDIIADKYGFMKSQITPASHLQNDLKMDSMDMVELELDLEYHFSREINLADTTDEMQTVGDIINYIFKLKK